MEGRKKERPQETSEKDLSSTGYLIIPSPLIFMVEEYMVKMRGKS